MDIPIKMEIILDKSIFAKNIKHLRKSKKLTQGDLSDFIGAKTTSLSNWEVGSALPELEKLIAISNYFGISVENMLLVPFEEWDTTNNHASSHNYANDPERKYFRSGIPLIPAEAMAGLPNGDVQVNDYEIKDRYVIPDFKNAGVDFLIRASGSSMYPKYSNGDVLACKRITELNFIQWGKVYILDTNQGPIIKRMFKSPTPENIECRSDNKEHYPPFEIRKADIRSVAIVIGVIRLE